MYSSVQVDLISYIEGVVADKTNSDFLTGQHAMLGKSRGSVLGIVSLGILEHVPCFKIVGHGGNGLMLR
jgi:hypothetical protein